MRRYIRRAVQLGVVVLASGCARNYYTTAARSGGSAQLAASAGEVWRVEVRARQGSLHFEASNADTISYRVRIGNARGALGIERDCDQAEETPPVRARQGDGVMALSLNPAPGDECVVEWRIRVPSHVLVYGRLNAGSITVSGARGGVDVQTGAGDVTVEALDGPIEAETSVGTIRVTASDAAGRVSAETSVGKTDLYVDGRKLNRARAPGSGDRFTLEGYAGNAIRLSADVGNIVLRLNRSATRVP